MYCDAYPIVWVYAALTNDAQLKAECFFCVFYIDTDGCVSISDRASCHSVEAARMCETVVLL